MCNWLVAAGQRRPTQNAAEGRCDSLDSGHDDCPPVKVGPHSLNLNHGPLPSYSTAFPGALDMYLPTVSLPVSPGCPPHPHAYRDNGP